MTSSVNGRHKAGPALTLGDGRARQDRVSAYEDVLSKFRELYGEVFHHDGYGEIRVEMRILKRGQKEVIIHCGKQYRYVVDFVAPA